MSQIPYILAAIDDTDKNIQLTKKGIARSLVSVITIQTQPFLFVTKGRDILICYDFTFHQALSLLTNYTKGFWLALSKIFDEQQKDHIIMYDW